MVQNLHVFTPTTLSNIIVIINLARQLIVAHINGYNLH